MLDWSDHAVRPAVNTTATLNTDIENLHFGSQAAPASIHVTAAIQGSLDNLDAAGTLALSPDAQVLNMNVLIRGLRAGSARSYFPSRVRATLSDGVLKAGIKLSSRKNPAGGETLDLSVADMDFRDAGSSTSLLDFDSFHARVDRIDPTANIIALDDVTLKNLDTGVRRTSDGLEILGLQLATNSAGSVDPPPAATPAVFTATSEPSPGNAMAQIAQERQKLPLLSLSTLDLGVRSIRYLDATEPRRLRWCCRI